MDQMQEQGTYLHLRRLQRKSPKTTNAQERCHIGQHKFEQITATPLAQSEDVLENRQRFINFCMAEDLTATNTTFKNNK